MSNNIVKFYSLVRQFPLWTPASISTELWLDASDASTITEDTGSVSEWADKSGNGYDALQGTALNQPITGTRTFANGLNVLDFDGANTTMAITVGPQADSAQTIMIAVADFDSPLHADGQRLLNFQDGGSTRWGLMVQGVSGTDAQYVNASSFTGPLEPITAGERLISGYRDGTAVGTGVDGVYATDSSGANATITAWNVGSYNSTGDFLNGGCAEVVVLKSYSVDTLQKLEGYLAWKWGLVGNLPIGHPYKSSAPRN
jgi:hypothetical protein